MKTVGFPCKLYKTCFQAMRRTFLPNRMFQRFRSKNRSTGLKFTPIRENSRLAMKIVQNVLLWPCGGRFGQVAFLSVSDLKIVLPASNCPEYVKIVPFPLKLYKTRFSGRARHVLGKAHFPASQISKSSYQLKWSPLVKNSALAIKIVKKKTHFCARAENVLAKAHFSSSEITK